MYQGKRHSKENNTAYHLNIPAQRKWYVDTSVEKMATMFDSIYVDPFDNDDPCEQFLNFAIYMLATSKIKKSLFEYLDK